jgi:hypothetical protein
MSKVGSFVTGCNQTYFEGIVWRVMWATDAGMGLMPVVNLVDFTPIKDPSPKYAANSAVIPYSLDMLTEETTRLEAQLARMVAIKQELFGE